MLNIALEAMGNPRIISKTHCINNLEKQLAEYDVCVSRRRDECQSLNPSVLPVEPAGRRR